MIPYDNSHVRRQDRLLDSDRAFELLATAEYAVLSMVDSEGYPYGVPVNFVWDGKDSIYIHCAPEGRKLRCVDACSRVSLCVVGRVHLLPSKFTTEYESLVMTANVVRHLSDDERHDALALLLDKLSPNDKEIGLRYAQASFHRVEILRLDIVDCSGKCKCVPHAD